MTLDRETFRALWWPEPLACLVAWQRPDSRELARARAERYRRKAGQRPARAAREMTPEERRARDAAYARAYRARRALR